MTYELEREKRVRIKAETTFGTDASASIANFKDLRCITVNPNTAAKMLEDESLQQQVWTSRKAYVGSKADATLELQFYLRGLGAALADSVAGTLPATFGQGILLTTLFGYASTGSGSTIVTGTSASTFTLDTGDGAQFGAGGFIGVTISGKVEVRPILSVIGDVVTLSTPLSVAPSVGAVVVNAYNFFTVDHTLSMQAVVEGRNREDIFWMRGLQGTLGIDLSPGEMVKATANLKCVDWVHDNDAGTPLGGSSWAADSLSAADDGNPLRWIDSEVQLVPSGGATPWTRTVICPSAISIKLDRTVKPLPCPSGVNGVASWQVHPSFPSGFGAEITIPYTDSTYWSGRAAKTRYDLLVQIGNTAPGICAITMKNMQIMDVQRTEYGEGMTGQKLTLRTSEMTTADLSTQSPCMLGIL